MIDKTRRLTILLTATIGLLRSGALAAEALPPRALARIGDHRFYHGPRIDCAALSPDGRLAASAAEYPRYSHGIAINYISDKERDAYDPVIILWDTATAERLRELRVPHGVVWQLAFSPDGKQLAAAYAIRSGTIWPPTMANAPGLPSPPFCASRRPAWRFSKSDCIRPRRSTRSVWRD
ncbi:MAG TPA: hypothetical protein VMG10_30385 [Gemmataceae bacterium]|nr:hypothetical protein [Gemmataceae bacterium]